MLVLARRKQLAFALLIVERMFPGLLRFTGETNFDPGIFITSRNQLWDILSGSRRDDPSQLASSDELSRATPDTEDYSTPLVSQGLNAAVAVLCIVEFLRSGHCDHIVELSGLATDSVDAALDYLVPNGLTFKDAPKVEARICAHPLMQQELQRQASDLRFLAGLPKELDALSVEQIRLRSKRQPDLLQLDM